MTLRHEWKHELSPGDMAGLRTRLSLLLTPDKHTINGEYVIRSLYFDNLYDTALREKLDGVNIREKFRIRLYNMDTSFIALEKKSKRGDLSRKDFVPITPELAAAFASGDPNAGADSSAPLVRELRRKMQTVGLKPKTLVEYTRIPFVYDPGNVRVTIDYNIRTGLRSTDLLNPEAVTVPAGNAPILLEVKWDAFLPDLVRDAVQVPSTRSGAFSKYAACRIYG